jgi:hypothetical protein
MEHFFNINIYKLGYTRLFLDNNSNLREITSSEDLPKIFNHIHDRLHTVIDKKKVNWTVSVLKKDSNILWGYGAWLPEITDDRNRRGLKFIHIKETSLNNLFYEIQLFLKLLFGTGSSSLVSILANVAKTPNEDEKFITDIINIFNNINYEKNIGNEFYSIGLEEKISKIDHDIVGSSSIAWLTLAFQQCINGLGSWEIYDNIDSYSNEISTLLTLPIGKSIKASELQRLLLDNLNKQSFKSPQPHNTDNESNTNNELNVIKRSILEINFLLSIYLEHIGKLDDYKKLKNITITLKVLTYIIIIVITYIVLLSASINILHK